MDTARREQILEAYACHARRFDDIASRSHHPRDCFLKLKDDSSAGGSAGPSKRQQEVLCLIAHGFSNDEISSKLNVSLETVKTHVGRILDRMGARNRAHAVFLACERGLVEGAPTSAAAGWNAPATTHASRER